MALINVIIYLFYAASFSEECSLSRAICSKIVFCPFFLVFCLYCTWESYSKSQCNCCQNREESHTSISNYWKRLWFVIHANYGTHCHNGKKTNNHTPNDNFFFRYGVINSFINCCVISKAIPTALSLIWRCFHGARSEIKNLAYQYSRKGKVFHRGAMC